MATKRQSHFYTMKKSQGDFKDEFSTTNNDYGSFYLNSDQITTELQMNDRIRNECRAIPSIAYEILFDVRIIFFFIE